MNLYSYLCSELHWIHCQAMISIYKMKIYLQKIEDLPKTVMIMSWSFHREAKVT